MCGRGVNTVLIIFQVFGPKMLSLIFKCSLLFWYSNYCLYEFTQYSQFQLQTSSPRQKTKSMSTSSSVRRLQSIPTVGRLSTGKYRRLQSIPTVGRLFTVQVHISRIQSIPTVGRLSPGRCLGGCRVYWTNCGKAVYRQTKEGCRI